MKFCLLSLSLFSISAVTSINYSSFHHFTMKYNKTYDTPEMYDYKKYIYEKNMNRISQLETKHPHLTFEMNIYGDLTSDEFHKTMKGYYSELKKTKGCDTYVYQNLDVPSSWDWREKGAVTPVKDQGQCGSCWSFSSTGSMEGAWFISKGELLNLSEQLLVDCSKKYVNLGCNGGEMDNAFDYAIDNGMCLEEDVPYIAETNSCSNDEQNCERSATFSSCYDVESKNQVSLEEAVFTSPVSVAIEADTSVFQFYKGGVLDSDQCGTKLDHGVLVVGYGTENNQDYWIVKNSWGESWGENGYIRIEKSSSTNSDGICGIAMQPSFIRV